MPRFLVSVLTRQYFEESYLGILANDVVGRVVMVSAATASKVRSLWPRPAPIWAKLVLQKPANHCKRGAKICKRVHRTGSGCFGGADSQNQGSALWDAANGLQLAAKQGKTV